MRVEQSFDAGAQFGRSSFTSTVTDVSQDERIAAQADWGCPAPDEIRERDRKILDVLRKCDVPMLATDVACG